MRILFSNLWRIRMKQWRISNGNHIHDIIFHVCIDLQNTICDFQFSLENLKAKFQKISSRGDMMIPPRKSLRFPLRARRFAPRAHFFKLIAFTIQITMFPLKGFLKFPVFVLMFRFSKVGCSADSKIWSKNVFGNIRHQERNGAQ